MNDHAYIEVADVRGHVPQIEISADSVITPMSVDSYIDVVEVEFNAILSGQGIVVPVTEESSVKVLRSLGIPGVLYQVFRANSVRPGARNSGEPTSREQAERANYRDNKRLLQSGVIANQLLQNADVDENVSQGPTVIVTEDDMRDHASDWHEFTDAEYSRSRRTFLG